MIFRARSEAGGLLLPPEAARFLVRYDHEPMHVEVTPVYSRRSFSQNRRLWAGYTRALRSFSVLSRHDREELHDAMKNRFLEPVRLYTADGQVIGEARSTKRLSVPAFGDYMEQVSALFANWGCDIYPDAVPLCESEEG